MKFNLKNVLFSVGIFAFAFAMFGLSAHKAEAAVTCTANAPGLWNAETTWNDGDCGAGHYPVAGDTVIIPASVTVTITGENAEAAAVTLNNAGGADTNLVISDTSTLHVTGITTLSLPGGAGTTTLAVGAGTLNTGSLVITGGIAGRTSQVTATAGGTITTGNVTFTLTTAILQTTGAAFLNLTNSTVSAGGTVNISTTTLTTLNGTNTINGAYNLGKVQVASGATTLGAALTVTGLQIDATASIANGGFLITDSGVGTGTSGFKINGTLSGTGATTLSGIGATIDGTGTIGATGILTLTGAKTIASTAVLSIPSTIALSATTTVTNNGAITTTGAAGITGAAADSIWTQGTNSTLNFGGGTTTLLNGAAVLNASATGNLVNYNLATNPQTVKVAAAGYYNLTLSGGGSSVKTIGTGTTVNHYLNIATATLASVTSGGNSNVFALKFNNIFQYTGTWARSLATHNNTTYFSAGQTGTLTVAHNPSDSVTTTTYGTPAVTSTPEVTITVTPVVETTLPVGCSTGDLFSPTSGLSCGYATALSPVVPGCSTGDAFSATTGTSCGTSTTTTSTTTTGTTTTTTGATTTTAVKFTSSVTTSSLKDDVKNLQTALNSLLGTTLAVDGSFGPKTTAAVKSFQTANGLTADGKFGPKSLAKLNTLLGL